MKAPLPTLILRRVTFIYTISNADPPDEAQIAYEKVTPRNPEPGTRAYFFLALSPANIYLGRVVFGA